MDMDPKPQAWMVIAADGRRHLYFGHDEACRNAVQKHGLVYALVFGRRADDKPDEGGE